MRKFQVLQMLIFACVPVCRCQDDQQQGGQNQLQSLLSFIPDVNNQDFQFLGLFQVQPAQSATVSAYTLPDSTPDSSETRDQSTSVVEQDQNNSSNDQPPITLQLPQTPSLVYPADSQSSSSIPMQTTNGQPPITKQLPQTPSLVYPVTNQQVPAGVPPPTVSSQLFPSSNFPSHPPITNQIPSTTSFAYPQPMFLMQPMLPSGMNQFYPTFSRITSLSQALGLQPTSSQPPITQRIPQTPSLIYPPSSNSQLAPAQTPFPSSCAQGGCSGGGGVPIRPCQAAPTVGSQLPLPCQMLMQMINAQNQVDPSIQRQVSIRGTSSPPVSGPCPCSSQSTPAVFQLSGFSAIPFQSPLPMSYSQPAPAIVDPLGPLGPQGFGDPLSPVGGKQIQAFRNYFMQLAQGVASSTPSSLGKR